MSLKPEKEQAELFEVLKTAVFHDWKRGQKTRQEELTESGFNILVPES